MAVYWSWAFGNETAAQLNDEMGFNLNTTDAAYAKPISDATGVYSYPGSPTRFSLDLSMDTRLETPSGVWTPAGWIAMPIRTFQGWESDRSSPLMQAYGDNQQVYIWCDDEGAKTLRLSFYTATGFTNSDHSIPGSFPDGDWRYFALKYDTSVAQPNAEVWVDGTLILSATASWTGVANTDGYYKFGGYGNAFNVSSLNAPLAQIIIYDTGSLSSGYPYDPRFVTRVEPTIDETGVGTFTPSVGTSSFAVLDSPFDSSTFTANTSSVAGDRVVCQTSGASGFYSQLGTTPTDFRGVTVHGWASGSGQNGFVGISDNNSVYDTGSHITPDISDPTYAYATATDQPSDAAAWNTGSLLYVKYEVS